MVGRISFTGCNMPLVLCLCPSSSLCCSSSACDPSGEVWDVCGLYVADGSVFPTPSGVNPMITIYGIAYLTAQGIVSRWKQQVQPARGGSVTSAAQ